MYVQLRRCIGSERFGIEAHDAPVTEFPAQPSQKDGLGRMCKPHWRQYTNALRKAALERATPKGDGTGAETPGGRRTKPTTGGPGKSAPAGAGKPKTAAKSRRATKPPRVKATEPTGASDVPASVESFVTGNGDQLPVETN
jgi:hypothetical protein